MDSFSVKQDNLKPEIDDNGLVLAKLADISFAFGDPESASYLINQIYSTLDAYDMSNAFEKTIVRSKFSVRK